MMTSSNRENASLGVAFWLVSAVRGTAVMFVGTAVMLWCVFSITAVRSDGFSVHAIIGTLPLALLWSLVGIVLTCVVSIPAATLVTGVIRIGHRRRMSKPDASGSAARHGAQQSIDGGSAMAGTTSATRRFFNRTGLFALVDDPSRGLKEIHIPVGNRMIDYDEFYRLTDRQFTAFVDDPHAAKIFADECRRREHDDLLRLAPGTDRGSPWIPDTSAASLSTLMFYDTTTSAPAGYALGFHARSRARNLSIPPEPGHVHGVWRHFEVSPVEHTHMTSDAAAAVRFAAECRAGNHDDRRISAESGTR